MSQVSERFGRRSGGDKPADAMSSGLSVRGVSVSFGEIAALDGLSFDVGQGGVFALLGPSGCGKSTALRVVAGLQRPDAGTVAWDGGDLVSTPAHRRKFSLMFQDGQLFAHRDVGGNVAYGMRGVAGLETRDARGRRVAELLDLVGLPGIESRDVTTLSGGQAQRVALARALGAAPRMILLDEPLSSLDRELRERLAGDLGRMLRASGSTALLVTHDLDEAFAMADRVGVMSDGSLLQVGTPEEVWNAPADEEVARFLGFKVVDGDVLRDPRWAGHRVGLGAGSLIVDSTGESALRGAVLGRVARRAGELLRVSLPGIGEVEVLPGESSGAAESAEVAIRAISANVRVV